MEYNIVNKEGLSASDIAKINRLSIEELIFSWLNWELSESFEARDVSSRNISIIHPHKEGLDEVIINLSCGEKTALQLGVKPVLLKAIAGKYPVLTEKVYKFADSDEMTPDLEWFERRDRRLGIKESRLFDEWTMPASAIIKMVSSYLYSSCGIVNIRKQLIRDYNYTPHDVFVFEFVFLVEESKNESGLVWKEGFVVPKKNYQIFLGRKRKTGIADMPPAENLLAC